MGDGTDFWNSFTGPTLFGEKPQPRAGQEGTVHPAGAVAVQVSIPAGATSQVHFYLAWHMPHWITADGTDQGHQYRAVLLRCLGRGGLRRPVPGRRC